MTQEQEKLGIIGAWRLLPRALHYLRPYRGQTTIAVVLTVLLALVALAEPWPLAFIVDGVLSGKPLPPIIERFVGTDTGALILFAVGASLAITLLSGAMTVVSEYVQTKVDQRMVLDFRSDMFRHAQRLSLAFHDSKHTGLLMYQINNQSASVGNIVVALPPLIQSVLTLVGMVYIAFRIDAVLALLAISVVPFISYSTGYYGRKIEPQLYRVRRLEGQSLTIVHEAMAMLRVIVAFGRERHEFKRFRAQGERAVDARIKLTVRQTLFSLAVNFITAIGTALVLGVGAVHVLRGQISGGELLVVLAYIAAVYMPLETITASLASFQQQFIAFRHSLDLLDTPLEVEEAPDAIQLDRVDGEVVFDNVSFSYRSRPNALRDISFKIPAGDAIAIVGPTGAGKSTLVSLIPRLYDCQRGRVLIDGVDVRDLGLASLREQFSIVLQEPLLFSGTIADNIRYGRLDATRGEIEEAAKAANAHDFIMQLPKKYDTKLGERGSQISGGERQRIAVARAFLKDAPILILDEPTSSIDSKTEGVILEALERLMQGRTTIMIAHRLSTLRSVDKILVLNHGELVQQGTHDELVEEEDALYRLLWDAQTGAKSRPAAGRELPAGEPVAVAALPATTGNQNGHAPMRPAELVTLVRETLLASLTSRRRKSVPPAPLELERKSQ